MSRNKARSNFNPTLALKKFALSAFVVIAFIAYAIHERLINSDSGSTAVPSTPDPAATQDPSNSSSGSPASNLSSPLSSSGSASSAQGAYKDGTYTGPEVDVNYGLVKVQATVKNGKITDVQVPEYPTDRRTSQQINTIAVPYLQQEALQAQSANVDIISGATLTSEGFAMSLQSALANAH